MCRHLINLITLVIMKGPVIVQRNFAPVRTREARKLRNKRPVKEFVPAQTELTLLSAADSLCAPGNAARSFPITAQ
jgi:hypothetical protein